MPETILQTLEHIPETNILGTETREWGISAQICPALRAFHIRGVGLGSPGRGYRIVRHRPPFSHINVCIEGEGRTLVDGRWRPFLAGTAGLFPRMVPHGGHWDDSPWRMCWVLYDEPPGKKPLLPGPDIRFVATDPRPFERALLGLHEELHGRADARLIELWVELLHRLVVTVADSAASSSRLARVWEVVDSNLVHPWTAADLASLACMSEVHLRRVAAAEVGRTPLQHVAFLRVRRAAYLLETQAETVENVASQVGYQSISAFTSAFKRWLGRLPRRK